MGVGKKSEKEKLALEELKTYKGWFGC